MPMFTHVWFFGSWGLIVAGLSPEHSWPQGAKKFGAVILDLSKDIAICQNHHNQLFVGIKDLWFDRRLKVLALRQAPKTYNRKHLPSSPLRLRPKFFLAFQRNMLLMFNLVWQVIGCYGILKFIHAGINTKVYGFALCRNPKRTHRLLSTCFLPW